MSDEAILALCEAPFCFEAVREISRVKTNNTKKVSQEYRTYKRDAESKLAEMKARLKSTFTQASETSEICRVYRFGRDFLKTITNPTEADKAQAEIDGEVVHGTTYDEMNSHYIAELESAEKIIHDIHAQRTADEAVQLANKGH